MNKKSKFLSVLKKWTFKVIKRTLATALILLVSLFILLQFSAVQTYIAGKLSDRVSKEIGYEIRIEKVQIRWFDYASLQNITIQDPDDHQMIKVEELLLDFKFTSLFKNPVVVEDAVLTVPHVKLFKNEEGVLNMNKFIAIIRKYTMPKKKRNKKKKLIAFQLNNIHLVNGAFWYNDLQRPKMNESGRFDYNHFAFDSIYADGNNLFILRDTFNVDINNLRGREIYLDFPIKNIETEFRMNNGKLEMGELTAKLGSSTITDLIRFEYNHVRNLSYFNDSVQFTLDLDSTQLTTQDLSIVAPALRRFTDTLLLSGELKGKMADLKWTDLDLEFGQNSRIQGELELEGLPDIHNTWIQADLKKAVFESPDIEIYAPQKYFKHFKKFGHIEVDSRFDGFPTDFVAYGDFKTDLGRFKSDLNFKIKEPEHLSSYNGKLTTYNFDIGTFLNRKYLGHISMSGKVKGVGFTINDADLTIDAKATSFEVKQHHYKNIVVDAEIKKGYFEGKLSVQDDFLKGKTRGKIDLRDQKNKFQIKTTVEEAHLKKLGITKDSSFFKGQLALNFDWKGFDFKKIDIDEIRGKGKLENAHIYYGNKDIDLTDFGFRSTKVDSLRYLNIKSSYADIDLVGNYEFKSFFNDISHFYKEVRWMLSHDKRDSTKFNDALANKQYDLNFEVKVKKVNQLLDVFYPDVQVSNHTAITGQFHNGKNKLLNMYGAIEKVEYQDFEFYHDTIDINVSLENDGKGALGAMLLKSGYQTYRKNEITKDAILEVIMFDNNLNFDLDVAQYGLDNELKVIGAFEVDNHEAKVSFDPYGSFLRLDNKKWKITPHNQIITKDHFNDVSFQNFGLREGKQKIDVTGGLSRNRRAILDVEMGNINVAYLQPIVKTKVEGDLKGQFTFENIFHELKFESQVKVDDFAIDGFKLGHLEGGVSWIQNLHQLDVDLDITRDSTEIVALRGKYLAQDKVSPLQMYAEFDSTEISILEPYLFGHITNLEGSLHGKVDIRGTLKHPEFHGKTWVRNGALKVSYLNTKYYFQDYVYFNDDSINVKQLKMQDSLRHFHPKQKNHYGILNGGITHNMFKDFKVDLNMYLKNILALNTTKLDNELYYGKAYGTGDVRLHGTFDDLHIDANKLTSEPGTEIVFISSGSGTVSKKEWIEFVSIEEAATNARDSIIQQNNKKVSGVHLKLGFDINSNAKATVVYDDEEFKVKQGRGNIFMEFDTRDDELTMVGDYEILKGDYNFKFANVIDKEFKAVPGGTVSWSGDPYKGKLNLTAVYKLKTSLAPLMDTSTVDVNSSEINRQYPVLVLMKLTGQLLSPEIEFLIDFEDYPRSFPGKNGGSESIEAAITQFKKKLEDNEQELNRQVFSLMVLQQLSYENSLQGEGGVGSNVTELIANQFSSLLSQVDENIEVDIDLNGLDEEAFQAMRVRLSLLTLGGKVKITRDGGFTNVDNSTDINSVVGDVTVEYFISDDGKFRIKVYNKTNQNTISTSLQNTNSQLYGASLLYTQSFSGLKDLFKKKGEGNKAKTDKERADAILKEEEKPEDKSENKEAENQNVSPSPVPSNEKK